jgi:hypothetical protein
MLDPLELLRPRLAALLAQARRHCAARLVTTVIHQN